MRYQVKVTRDTTESALVVVIDAPNKEAAAELALEYAHLNSYITWEPNGECINHPYLGDCVDEDVTEIQPTDKEIIALYSALHGGLDDMIEGQRLIEADIPDDYHWLIKMLEKLDGMVKAVSP